MSRANVSRELQLSLFRSRPKRYIGARGEIRRKPAEGFIQINKCHPEFGFSQVSKDSERLIDLNKLTR